jgi:hypothetical protein
MLVTLLSASIAGADGADGAAGDPPQPETLSPSRIAESTRDVDMVVPPLT